MVPAAAVTTRSGIDFVRVDDQGIESERTVVLGEAIARAEGVFVEILTGLAIGEAVVVTP